VETSNSIYSFNSKKPTVLTLGTFDGVHKGHQSILKKIKSISESENLESVVLTFFPHPRNVVNDELDLKLLNTIKEKQELLENFGIDCFIVHPFDKVFSELSPREFVEEILVKQLNVKKVVIGHDHKFGKNRAANYQDLINFGKEFNFDVEEISAKLISEVSVSSTKIRNAIIEGDINLANSYLGHNYQLNGIVVKGQQLGRTINFPTANIQIEEDYKLIPKNGVYVVSSKINNKIIFGMMNIGNRPTVHGKTITIEVHFLDFKDDLYDQYLSVNVLTRIRDEVKFDSLEILKNQLEKDLKHTINFVNN
jgi:riboflavin kinase / FMN adenylyltransferase